MNDILFLLLNVGITSNSTLREVRTIRVSNLVYFTIGICCVLVATVSWYSLLVSYIYFFIAFTSFGMVGLNYFGHYNAARIIFTLVLNIGILTSSGLCQSSISYAGDRLFFLVNIALASVIFDFSEKKMIIPVYIFLLVLLVGFDPLQSLITSEIPIELYDATPPAVYYTKFGLAGVTVALCFIYLQYIYAESQKSTLKLYQEVQKNNQQLGNTLKELRSTQDQLVHSNTELRQFASVVSHDLKAPLRAIGTLADFINIDQRENLDQEGQEKLDLLKKRVVRMDNLINGILSYAKVGQDIDKKVKINLNNLIGVVIDMLAPPDNIQIDVQKVLPEITGEPTRIQQLFQNILSNAIKFSDKPLAPSLLNVRTKKITGNSTLETMARELM